MTYEVWRSAIDWDLTGRILLTASAIGILLYCLGKNRHECRFGRKDVIFGSNVVYYACLEHDCDQWLRRDENGELQGTWDEVYIGNSTRESK